MTTAESYAQALHALVLKEPKQGGVYLQNLFLALKRRGHEKLAEKIFVAYQKLDERKERLTLHTKVTPESEHTRILLELYRTLVSSK